MPKRTKRNQNGLEAVSGHIPSTKMTPSATTTTTETPKTNAVKQSPITESIFDLSTLENVTRIKVVPDFIPAENTTEVLARVGNDAAKMLALLNAGLKSEERSKIEADSTIPWMVKDEENDVLVPFTGTPVDDEKFGTLKSTLSKTVFGYNKSMTKEQKQEAKAAAVNMIKTNAKMFFPKEFAATEAAKVPETPVVVETEVPPTAV